jgi:hypothetical protein
MPTSRNSKGDRLPNSTGTNPNPNDTAKQNYTAIRQGNDHGSISFGHIHQPADVTAAVKLETPDGRHTFFLDEDGPRKGWTTSTSPGNFQLLCGMDNPGNKDSALICAENGNIVIRAMNGRIRLEALDIDIIAESVSNTRGNIQIKANEGIKVDCKNLNMTATSSWKIVSTGIGEISANTSMKIYSSMIRGVTDAVANRDCKLGNRKFQRRETFKPWA